MNEDFQDMIAALLAVDARFLVVGAHAMAVYGVPRATGDLDLWFARDEDNARRVWDALQRFGAPAAALGVSRADLVKPGTVVQIGVPPRRIDLMTEITAVEFEDAWTKRRVHRVGEMDVPFLDRESLIQNKRAVDRSKDRADLDLLEGRS
jgi:hypothetical protein